MIGRAAAGAVLFGAVVVSALLPAGATKPSEGSPAPDLKAALMVDGRCGRFADDLPVLVAEAGMAPGDQTAPVAVCLANRGPRAGRLVLGVDERVETEAACTGDEAFYDASCGAGGVGELGGALRQRVHVDPTCKRRGVASGSSAVDTALSGLESNPLVLGTTVRPDQVVCVALWLVAGSDPVAQSDQVTWRYVFTLED